MRRSRRVERRAGRASIDVGPSRTTGRRVPARLTPVAETTHRGRSRSTTGRRISPRRKTIPTQHARRRGADRTADRGHTRAAWVGSGSTKGATRPLAQKKNRARAPKTVQKTRKFFTRYPCALLDPPGHIDVGQGVGSPLKKASLATQSASRW